MLKSTALSVGPTPQSELPEIKPIPRPGGGTELSTQYKLHQTRRIQTVAAELWPNTNGRPPPGVSVAERNQVLRAKFADRDWAPPSVRHLQRVFGGR